MSRSSAGSRTDEERLRKELGTLGWQKVKRLAEGGTGIVFRAVQPHTGRAVAIKVLKPNLADRPIMGDKASRSSKTFAQSFQREIQVLANLNHPCLMEIVGGGAIRRERKTVPYFVMPFYKPIWSLYEYVDEQARTRNPVVFFRWLRNAMMAIGEALAYVHGQRWLHRDIKGENIVVDAHGHARLTDFGSAWLTPKDSSGDTITVQDSEYLHPKLTEYLQKAKASDTRRVYVLAPRELLAQYGVQFDLFALGESLQRALRRYDVGGPYASMLEHVAGRLKRSGIDANGYDNCEAFLADLRRINIDADAGAIVPELGSAISESITLAPTTSIPIREGMLRIIDAPLFRRLRWIKQLGFADEVYPSARHTRFEHSLGVYYWARRFLLSLWHQPNSYLRAVAQVEHIQATLLAALLHDLGQYPFAHAAEGAHQQKFSHETLGAALVNPRAAVRAILSPSVQREGDRLRDLIEGAYGPKVLAITTSLLTNVPSVAPELIGPGLHDLLRSVFDGPIDADKMDYLRRDSLFTGLGNQLQGMEERFLPALTVSGNHNSLAIKPAGRDGAEQMLDQRYRLFKWVYWHRTVRAHESLLSTVFEQLARVNTSEEWRGAFLSKALSQTDDSMVQMLIDECQTLADPSFGVALARLRSREKPARVLTVGPTADGQHEAFIQDADLYRHLTSLRNSARDGYWNDLLKFRQAFAGRITKRLGFAVGGGDVVIDIPIPERHRVGQLYLQSVEGKETEMNTISHVWGKYGADFEEVVRRVRVFVRPELRAKLAPADVHKDMSHSLENYSLETLP